MVGYTRVTAAAELDLTDRLDPAERAQLFQIRLSWHSDRGLSTIPDPGLRLRSPDDRAPLVVRGPVPVRGQGRSAHNSLTGVSTPIGAEPCPEPVD